MNVPWNIHWPVCGRIGASNSRSGDLRRRRYSTNSALYTVDSLDRAYMYRRNPDSTKLRDNRDQEGEKRRNRVVTIPR